jgi:hypothetical protein
MRLRFNRMDMIIVATVMLSSAWTAVAQELESKKSFEGILEVQVQNTERVQLYTFTIKNGKIRVEPSDVSDAAQVILIDYPAKRTYVLLPAHEQYVEIPPPTDVGRGQSGLQRTDVSDEILDYNCDQFMVKSPQAELEIWATKEFGMAGTMLTNSGAQSFELPAWETELFAMGYFPMKVIIRDASGYDAGKFEVNSVQKKSVGDFLFRIPRGYEKVERDALDMKPAPAKKKRTR